MPYQIFLKKAHLIILFLIAREGQCVNQQPLDSTADIVESITSLPHDSSVLPKIFKILDGNPMNRALIVSLNSEWERKGCGGCKVLTKAYPLFFAYQPNLYKHLPQIRRYGGSWFVYKSHSNSQLKRGDELISINGKDIWNSFPIEASNKTIVKFRPNPFVKIISKDVDKKQLTKPIMPKFFKFEGKLFLLIDSSAEINQDSILKMLNNEVTATILDLRSPSPLKSPHTTLAQVLKDQASKVAILVNHETSGPWSILAFQMKKAGAKVWGEPTPKTYSQFEITQSKNILLRLPSQSATPVAALTPDFFIKDTFIYSEGHDLALEHCLNLINEGNLL